MLIDPKEQDFYVVGKVLKAIQERKVGEIWQHKGGENMRKFICTLVLVFILAAPALAHSGRTDSNGGHTDSRTGTYDYHGKKGN